MKIGLYFYPKNNFGDTLNALLMPQLFPQLRPMNEQGIDAVLLGIGSILGIKAQHSYFPFVPRIVFGTGYQYESPRPLPDGSLFKCVRGMYTCERYGLNGVLAVADPAILTPFIYPRTRPASKATAVVHKWDFKKLNPHYIYDPDEFDANVSVEQAESFIEKLWDYENVITDSLHTAIVCDAYGIPWKPTRWEPKWVDHFRQLQINSQPNTFIVSNRNLLATRAVGLLQIVDQIKGMMND